VKKDTRTLNEVAESFGLNLNEQAGDKPPKDTPVPGSNIKPDKEKPANEAHPLDWFTEQNDDDQTDEQDNGNGDDEKNEQNDDDEEPANEQDDEEPANEQDDKEGDDGEPENDIEEQVVPKDVKDRAFRRMEDAIKRAGLTKAIRDTEIRIGKITNKEKMFGLIDALESMERSVAALRTKAQAKARSL